MDSRSMQVTIDDYYRITGLIAMILRKNYIPEVALLHRNLRMAKMTSQVSIPQSIVTMNSRFVIVYVKSQMKSTIEITYPHHAKPEIGKISVFSAMGAALLGCSVGDVVTVGEGKEEVKIESILYQPEAAGHYHL